VVSVTISVIQLRELFENEEKWSELII